MDASSLIFVAIIGIWAAYLMQHWVRRREQVVTSRAVDRFSSDLRVLERRVPTAVALPELASRPSGSYVVAPRVEVTMPVVTAATAGPAGPAPRVAPAPSVRPSSRARRRTHRLRALVLLTLLVATPVLWASHVLGTLLLWPAVAVTALLVLDLLLVRRMVRVQRRAATRARSGARPASATRPARRTASVRVPAQGRTTTTADGTPPIESVTSVTARAVAEVDPAAPRPVHSQEAVTEVIMLEGMWQPVRVPPPTYTMKAKADRVPVYSSSSAPMESDSSPERPVEAPTPPALVAVVDDELDAVLDRRRAAGE